MISHAYYSRVSFGDRSQWIIRSICQSLWTDQQDLNGLDFTWEENEKLSDYLVAATPLLFFWTFFPVLLSLETLKVSIPVMSSRNVNQVNVLFNSVYYFNIQSALKILMRFFCPPPLFFSGSAVLWATGYKYCPRVGESAPQHSCG